MRRLHRSVERLAEAREHVRDGLVGMNLHRGAGAEHMDTLSRKSMALGEGNAYAVELESG